MHPLCCDDSGNRFFNDYQFSLDSRDHHGLLLSGGVSLETMSGSTHRGSVSPPGQSILTTSDAQRPLWCHIQACTSMTADTSAHDPHLNSLVDCEDASDIDDGHISASGNVQRSGDLEDSKFSPTQYGLISATKNNPSSLSQLPNEILLYVLGFLDVSDLLATSRTNHLLRHLSLAPILHHYRLRRTRQILPPLLSSSARPTVADLIARSIFLTQTSVVSRRLAWSLVSIRLSRRLAARPSAESLVERCVLPKECVPGMASVYIAPALVAKRKAIEKERVKDGLRRWIAAKWKGEVKDREEELRKWHEIRGVGRVWRLTRFWERVSRGDYVR